MTGNVSLVCAIDTTDTVMEGLRHFANRPSPEVAMRRPLSLVCLCVALAGCAVPEVRRDHDQIREALLHLYTNQILDNLVRASNGLPIIQLDYTNASANLTIEETANFGDALQTTSSNVATVVAKSMLVLTHQAVATVTGSVGLNHTNSVSIMANPVLASDEVYNAYLTFLGRPGRLEVTCTPPPPGAAHVCRKFRKEYYWVPAQYREEFLDLALVTMAQRDRLLEAPEGYAVTLLRFDPLSYQKVPEGITTVWIDVDIDKEIPNYDGATEGSILSLSGVGLRDEGFLDLEKYRPIRKDASGSYYIREWIALPEHPERSVYYYLDKMCQPHAVDKKAYRPISCKFEEPLPDASGPFIFDTTKVLYVTKRLRIQLTESCYKSLGAKLPFPVLVKHRAGAPPAPTTDDLLDRIPFRVPQVKFEAADIDDPSGGGLRGDGPRSSGSGIASAKAPAVELQFELLPHPARTDADRNPRQ
jgi:hypothetical protein